MIQDITALLDREDGSAFDQDSLLFSAWDDGDIFHYDSATIRDYDEMLRRDGKARTLEQVLTLPIRQAPTTIRKGEARTKVAEFVEHALFSPANNGGMTTPLNSIIAQMGGAIVNKKAFFEKVFTEREGRIVYDKLAWRPPATCSVVRDKKNGAFRGFKQTPYRLDSNADDVFIKAIRAFVYIHGTHRNPLEGVSDLEIAYWCYQTKQKIRFLWYSFLEGQSLPKTVVKGRDEATAKRVARKLVALRSGGIVGIDDQIELDKLESSGRGAAQFKEALQWLDGEASGSVLAGFTDLGASAASGTGSFALSKDQTDFFLMSRQGDSREMADALNQYVIPDLVRWNFGPNERVPEFEFGPIAEDDAAMAVSLLQATAQSPSTIIPREFFDELIERVAGFLELNTNTVRDGLERARKEAEEKAKQQEQNPQVAGVAGAVDEATKMVADRAMEVSNGRRVRPNTAPSGRRADREHRTPVAS